MEKLLKKEIKLTAPPLTFIFIAFVILSFIPNYPILVSVFFVTYGLFHSYQTARESNDILFSILLPIKKKSIVRAKYLFAIIIEMSAFVLLIIFTLIRMFLMGNLPVYMQNVMMNANLSFLGYTLIVFGIFNFIFIGGFFKTAQKIGMPFLRYGIVLFFVITLAEVLHNIPGLGGLNSAGFDCLQLIVLFAGIITFILLTWISERKSEKVFEKLDL